MIRRTDSQGDVIHFFKIKDLHYFKQLLRPYDLSIVRQFLQNNLQIVQLLPFTSYLPEPNYRYISKQNYKIYKTNTKEPIQLKEGQVIPQIKEEIQTDEKVCLFRIAIKTEITLQRLFYLSLPILNGVKDTEKLAFYGNCGLLEVNYGTYIYRRGEPVNAIYYVLDGQVKISKKKGQSFVQLVNLQRGNFFGVYCMKHNRNVRQLMARASQNDTKILVIYREVLEQIAQQRETTIDKLLESVKSQLFSLVKKQVFRRREEDIENERRERQLTLEKRIRQFEEQRQVKNKFIEDLAQTKTLLIKVRDMNKTSRSQRSPYKSTLLPNKAQILSSRIKQRSNREHKTNIRWTETAMTTRGPNILQNSNMMRSFVGLARYPSVKKYLNLRSKPQ